MSNPFVDSDARVEQGANIGIGSKIWGLAQVRARARVGQNCVIGRGAYIDAGVVIGDNSKIQNDALIYEPAVLGAGVFVGPAVVLTNDQFPRAVTEHGGLKGPTDWAPVGVIVDEGASIGAHAVCVAPVHIGAWAMVGAGSVVTRDVAAFSLVRGAPARHVGWVGRAGKPLNSIAGKFVCPSTGETYLERDGRLALETNQ